MEGEKEEEEEELRRLLQPDAEELPEFPPSAVESNFTTYFATEFRTCGFVIYLISFIVSKTAVSDFMKPGHDQYVHRHANGLCVVGLAPTHVAFKDKNVVTSVDFNVGKSDRSGIKVTGKRKRNAQHFEANTALCKVYSGDSSFIVRCCIKGSLLEVNRALIAHPELLNEKPEREGFIAILMPKSEDWIKAKASLIEADEYRRLRSLHDLGKRCIYYDNKTSDDPPDVYVKLNVSMLRDILRDSEGKSITWSTEKGRIRFDGGVCGDTGSQIWYPDSVQISSGPLS
ncbi:hypothetical protein M569_10228 [Genlisea aurea]|uniref:Protein Abitram n=1 Tax=Genlisea aurea TaxID=192259 RepID=S8DNH4_9LAMI|nr:hypothetical protein M569_10228 [Genlisea aurea]